MNPGCRFDSIVILRIDHEESRRLYSETIDELEKIAADCKTGSYFFPPQREKIRMTSFVCVWYGLGPLSSSTLGCCKSTVQRFTVGSKTCVASL